MQADGLRAVQEGVISVESLELSEAAAAGRQAELNTVRLMLDHAESDLDRIEREGRKLKKGFESAEGEGSDAAARISELKRQLYLLTDGLKAAKKLSDGAQAKFDEARVEVAVLQRDLNKARRLSHSTLTAKKVGLS